MEQTARQEGEGRRQTRAGDGPSPAQRAYIQLLAKAAGLKLDVSTIGDRRRATRIIESLKLMPGRTTGNVVDAKDIRAAFGMATKLVFASYAGRERDLSKWSRLKFWYDVWNFYSAYLEQQDRAVAGNRME